MSSTRSTQNINTRNLWSLQTGKREATSWETRCTWGDNIKMGLGQTGCKGADWIEPA